MVGFATRSLSSVMDAIAVLNFLQNGTALHVRTLCRSGKPEIATLLLMLLKLLLLQRQRSIPLKHPKEETGNVASDLQLNPAHLKSGVFFTPQAQAVLLTSFSSLPIFKFFSLDNFPI
jgi:hypothetical protein